MCVCGAESSKLEFSLVCLRKPGVNYQHTRRQFSEHSISEHKHVTNIHACSRRVQPACVQTLPAMHNPLVLLFTYGSVEDFLSVFLTERIHSAPVSVSHLQICFMFFFFCFVVHAY